ncbi:hypothetical protein GE061_005896 [Apolygus lucorum]|uniref:Uncharacterized protein n=1 Tax=Apolygus lucorum TaxID=248454 RepID=A0A6A4IML3_APOLU|nr:hypothetical protein GE061_005896 [Apolygus lucorum]
MAQWTAMSLDAAGQIVSALLTGFTTETIRPSITMKTAHYIMKLPTLCDIARRSKWDVLMIGMVDDEIRATDEHLLEKGSFLSRSPSRISWWTGEFTVKKKAFQRMIVVECPKAAARFFQSMYHMNSFIASVAWLGLNESDLARAPETVKFPSISARATPAYLCKYTNLYTVLKDPQATQATKILSTIISLFPYTQVPKHDRVMVKDYTLPQEEDGSAELPEELLHDGSLSKDRLGLICLYFLGTAYSNPTRLANQISKRAKAVATVLGVTQPDDQVISQLITSTGWVTNDTPVIVDEFLGQNPRNGGKEWVFLCRNREGDVVYEIPIDELMDPGTVCDKYGLSKLSRELLSQGRLVYHSRHATSIRFIEPFFEAIIGSGHGDVALLEGDINNYNAVRDIILTCPFLGLRASLPERYHIKQFPCLVYGGLLYYKRSLATEEDRKLFDDYKLMEIKHHVPNVAAATTIELLVELMPTPGLMALISFIATSSIERAELILSTKRQEEVEQIYTALKQMDNPGPWAAQRIAHEDGEYKSYLLEEAQKRLREYLRSKDEEERDIATEIVGRAAQIARKESIRIWRREVNTRIDNLSAQQERLKAALTPTQNVIRNDLVASLNQIRALISAGPQGPTHPVDQDIKQ